MRAYRVSTVFSSSELLGFLDANPHINMTIEVLPDDEVAQPVQPPVAIYKPKRTVQRRKRRTKAEMQADALKEAAE